MRLIMGRDDKLYMRMGRKIASVWDFKNNNIAFSVKKSGKLSDNALREIGENAYQSIYGEYQCATGKEIEINGEFTKSGRPELISIPVSLRGWSN